MKVTMSPRLRLLARALGYLALEVLWAPVSIGLLVAILLVIPLLALGVGWFAVPTLARLLDWTACRAGARAARFMGTPAPSRRSDLAGALTPQNLAMIVSAPTSRRQFGWLAVHMTLILSIAVLGCGIAVSSVVYTFAPAYWWLFPPAFPLQLSIDVTSWPLAFLAMALGLLYAVLTWYLAPWAARRMASSTVGIISPRHYAELAERITVLATSRAAALDAHSSELRRIERELHDGAQNRLLGVVMMLGMAHRALETDPATALPFIQKAQDAATDALAELRNTVHDVYPPVLDELGLGGAASTLASRSAIPCMLDASGLRRAPAAVEAAAYFVVAEALTNAAKHSGGTQARVNLHTERPADEDILVIEVKDNGHGGATAGGEGTGVAGIARRAAAFEGTLTLSSPAGGPTTLRVELPCGF